MAKFEYNSEAEAECGGHCKQCGLQINPRWSHCLGCNEPHSYWYPQNLKKTNNLAPPAIEMHSEVAPDLSSEQQDKVLSTDTNPPVENHKRDVQNETKEQLQTTTEATGHNNVEADSALEKCLSTEESPHKDNVSSKSTAEETPSNDVTTTVDAPDKHKTGGKKSKAKLAAIAAVGVIATVIAGVSITKCNGTSPKNGPSIQDLKSPTSGVRDQRNSTVENSTPPQNSKTTDKSEPMPQNSDSSVVPSNAVQQHKPIGSKHVKYGHKNDQPEANGKSAREEKSVRNVTEQLQKLKDELKQ